MRVHGTQKGLAVTTDCTPRYCLAEPEAGGAQAVAEAYRNISATGAKPLAATNNLNFGNPQRKPIMGQLVGCVQGMGQACSALGTPIVSGNVSLYNETNGQAILPTPVIGMVGLLEDVSRHAVAAFGAEEETLLLVGETRGHLGQSLYARRHCGLEGGAPPPVDLAAEQKAGALVRAAIAEDELRSCHDLSDGGLLVAFAEMALAAGIGGELDPQAAGETPFHAWLFGEDQARYLVATSEPERLEQRAAEAGVPLTRVGRTGGASLTVAGRFTISLDELKARHEGWLPGYMQGEIQA